ncbi:MAG TPA: mandelate racemase/muconate lactonizing enzyme family protein [Planctomycetaceae bacterium]|nr:mandelate racemase/muconate lactonizing enzyme family protein [Planctomycetaceae bacterium]
MKITDIRAVQPVAPGSPPDWRTSLGQILVAVDTDRGLTGYGVGGGGLAAIHVVRTVLRDLLVGRDPQPVEELAAAMSRATLPFGRKGLAVMAQSGVDLALWDLRGKAAGQPIVELLGGRPRQPIPVYATVWHEVTAGQAVQFRAFKLHVGHTAGDGDPDAGGLVENVVAAVARARQTIGPDRSLMIDAWMQWDVPATLAVAQRIAPLDIGWIEEPLSPDDLAGYEELSRRCPVLIAGGEHEFTAIGFRPLIERRLHQVLQPDVCWCGGLTELIRIYELSAAAGLRVCPHRGAEVWALHAIAALDADPLAESGRPWMTWVGGQPAVLDGTIQVGDAPGFGVEIDEDGLP